MYISNPNMKLSFRLQFQKRLGSYIKKQAKKREKKSGILKVTGCSLEPKLSISSTLVFLHQITWMAEIWGWRMEMVPSQQLSTIDDCVYRSADTKRPFDYA